MTDARRERWTQRLGSRALFVVAILVAMGLGFDVGGATVAPAVVDVRRSTVISPVSAMVRAVHVRPGDEVVAGGVLVALDATALDLELALAEAELERVRVAVRARQVDVKDQDFEVGLRLQADAERARVTWSQAQAALRQDEQEQQSLAILIDKNQRLVDERLAGAQELDELQLRSASVRERIVAGRVAVEHARQLQETAEQRFAQWRSRPGHEDALLAPEAAAVRAQEERVKIARWRREQLVLRAPLAGRVEEVLVGAGDVVREGAPLATVFDPAATAVTAWVAEDAAARVHVGDMVTLRSVDGTGLVRRGVVRALGGGIVEVPTRLRLVPGEPLFGRAAHVALDGAGSPVLPGQIFEASFASSPASPHASQPSSSSSSSPLPSSLSPSPVSSPVSSPVPSSPPVEVR
jgi:multidrug resistance efflux pump